MNSIKIKSTLLLFFSSLLLCSYTTQLQAQDNKEKKKIVIITKKIDKNGNEVINKEILEGEAAENYQMDEDTKKELEAHGIDLDNQNDGKGKKRIRIKKKMKEEGDENETIDIEVEIDDTDFSNKKEGQSMIFISENGNVQQLDGDHQIIKIKKKKEIGETEEIEIMVDDTGVLKSDDGKTIIIMEDFNDNENTEIEKEIIEENGVKKEIITTRIIKTNNNKAFLGVTLIKGAAGGVTIDNVIENSPAEKADLKTGDLITHVNNTSVTSLDELTKALAPFNAKDSANITYQRNGKTNTTKVTLARNDLKTTSETKKIWKTDEDEIIEIDGKKYKRIKE